MTTNRSSALNNLSFEFKFLAENSDAGTIEGYGSVFGNADSHGDVIMRGAFNETLQKRTPKMLWQHRMDRPIGVWDEVREDDLGLYVKGRIITKTQLGAETVELIKAGVVSGLSIGYRTTDAEYRGELRMLKAVDLYEISTVTLGSNELATITGAKSIETERDLERALLEQGLSRKVAKAIAAQGKAFLEQRDAGLEGLDEGLRDAGLIEAIKKLSMIVKG